MSSGRERRLTHEPDDPNEELSDAEADRVGVPLFAERPARRAGHGVLRFCFELLDQAGGASQDDESLDFLQGAYAHVMGRNAYEGMASSLPANPDHPWADIMNAGRKVVFSRTLKTADWANTTIAAGDTMEEVDALRQGGD